MAPHLHPDRVCAPEADIYERIGEIVGASALSNLMAELEARLTNTPGDVTHEDITATIEEFERIAVPLRAFSRQSGV